MRIKRQRIVSPGGQVCPYTVACWSEFGVEEAGVETAILSPEVATIALPEGELGESPVYPTHAFWRTDGKPLVGWSPNDDAQESDVHRLLARCTHGDTISPIRVRLLGLGGEVVADLEVRLGTGNEQ